MKVQWQVKHDLMSALNAASSNRDFRIVATNKSDFSIEPIDPYSPLRLGYAAKLAFPNGGLSESGLRREIAKGRLPYEKIAGKLYVTLNDIKEMRRRCHVQAKAQDFISSPPGAPGRENSKSDPLGSLEMEAKTLPRDALRQKLAKLKSDSPNT